jgi:hypothetical protein
MCRSIHILRDGREVASDDDIRAAARQFVRKVSGFSRPTAKHQEAFELAVDDIADITRRLLAEVAANLPAKTPAAPGEEAAPAPVAAMQTTWRPRPPRT